MTSQKCNVMLFTLGGTVSMAPAGGGLTPGLDAGAIAAMAGGIDGIAEVTPVDFRRLASAHLTLDDIVALGAAIGEARSDAVVVVQGTDTLEETAFALDLILGGRDMPLVLTGAMRAPAQASADGPANLRAAIGVAAAGVAGTHVVMNDEIHHAWFVEKRATSGVDAFASPGFGPVGRIVEGRVACHLAFARPDLRLATRGVAPVALLTAAAGLEPWLLEGIEASRFEGLVVAGLGAGHVPPGWIEPLSRLAKARPVVLASRTGAGPVHRSTYGFAGSEIDLIGRGLITAGYLSPAKARLLLSLAIGAGLERDAIEAAFAAASMH